ncbi:dentin sialophosphoprotein isoform X1 [Epinephelus fuscoguttatus]|uniref:dentin sialophosphoprotein isoform X1 n=1 Tax=Epinephelus fuscoguttatus TaxID=293821 RepID=UPI0020D191ED|nr:dentin sialophosphoprotein isoform X1 [Epinephelus fuscoguttatus]
MLPPNLLVMWMVIFLVTTVSTAPVEEKEQEEVEVEVMEEAEGELSEEEEDDEDSQSQSQDKIQGAVGRQQTTTAAVVASRSSAGVAAGESTNVQDLGVVAAGESTNVQDLGASGGQPAGGGTPDGTAGSSTAAGGPSGSAGSRPTGSEGVDSDSNSNGQKLLNGGGGGGADSQTGVLGSFGGGVSHLDYTGPIDPSSHDFLLSLMGTFLPETGGGVPFTPGVHVSVPGDMTPPTQLDPTVMSSGVTAAPDLPADPVHHSDISIDQSGPDSTSLISGPHQSLYSSVSGSAHSTTQEDAAASSSSSSSSSSLSHSETQREQTGNGRQTLLLDSNADVMMMSAGGAESVTGLYIDLTASGLGLGHDVTESSPVVLHTETHTLHTVSGGYSNTDLVTMATDSMVTDRVSADPTWMPLDSSHPAVTDHNQTAGSVTEQYNPSGQGPEGPENVELEDTC